MTFSATCPNPMHRLFALAGGRERIDREMQDGWPDLVGAVAYILLEERGPEEWQQALALVIEASPANPGPVVAAAEAARLDAEQFWVGMMAEASGLDPDTGERVRPPINDRPKHHHHRRPRRRR